MMLLHSYIISKGNQKHDCVSLTFKLEKVCQDKGNKWLFKVMCIMLHFTVAVLISLCSINIDIVISMYIKFLAQLERKALKEL